MKQREIVLIVHNVRSSHNVGSLLRTADGLGVSRVILSGYTSFPKTKDDPRLPHLAAKIHNRIAKTALGAEDSVKWEHTDDILAAISSLQHKSYKVFALEQAPGSIKLPDFSPSERIAIIVGREIEGIEPEVLAACDDILEIPMFGQKESFNVVQAAAMALYHCTFS